MFQQWDHQRSPKWRGASGRRRGGAAGTEMPAAAERLAQRSAESTPHIFRRGGGAAGSRPWPDQAGAGAWPGHRSDVHLNVAAVADAHLEGGQGLGVAKLANEGKHGELRARKGQGGRDMQARLAMDLCRPRRGPCTGPPRPSSGPPRRAAHLGAPLALDLARGQVERGVVRGADHALVLDLRSGARVGEHSRVQQGPWIRAAQSTANANRTPAAAVAACMQARQALQPPGACWKFLHAMSMATHASMVARAMCALLRTGAGSSPGR